MKFEHLGSFKKGEPVPEWILAVEPFQPHLGEFTLVFACDCHAVAVTSGIWFINDVHGQDVMAVNAATWEGMKVADFQGKPFGKFVAGDSPVILTTRMNIMGVPGGKGRWTPPDDPNDPDHPDNPPGMERYFDNTHKEHNNKEIEKVA